MVYSAWLTEEERMRRRHAKMRMKRKSSFDGINGIQRQSAAGPLTPVRSVHGGEKENLHFPLTYTYHRCPPIGEEANREAISAVVDFRDLRGRIGGGGHQGRDGFG